MRVIKTNKLPDGTVILIENWNEDYSSVFPANGTIAAYPISKYTIPGAFSPKAGEIFRAQFDFDSAEQTGEAFNSLVNGEKQLTDYIDRLYYPRHAPCLTGKE
jgi:hypothetical protein